MSVSDAEYARYLEKKYAFKPIPHEYPFDPRVPAVIETVCGERPSFVLRKNRQEVVIEGPSVTDFLPHEDPDDEHSDYHSSKAKLQLSAHVLQVINELIENIEFGEETKRVFLIKDSRTGQYKVSQPRSLGLVKISCPLWATIIPVEEIIFTVFCPLSDRRGIWKGKEVDVMYAWNREDQKFLNNAMIGYRMAQRCGLDLTFEVYGHAVSKDGAVVGLVSEAAWGRPPQPHDRPLIYRTLAELQAAGCIYRAVSENRFMIVGKPEDSKVRLLDLHLLLWPGNQKELEELAEVFHWQAASTLFHELETYGPYGYLENLCPLERFYLGHEDIKLIVPPPRLGRNGEKIYSLLVWPDFFSTSWVEPWEGYEVREPAPDDEPLSIVELLHRRPAIGPIRQPVKKRLHRSGEEYNLKELEVLGRSSRVNREPCYSYDIAIRDYKHAVRRAGANSLTEITDPTAFIEEVDQTA